MQGKTELFMVPAGSTGGMLKPKEYQRKKTSAETVGMYFHKTKSIVFWANIDVESFTLPDPIKEYKQRTLPIDEPETVAT